jgi:hypothetical protein
MIRFSSRDLLMVWALFGAEAVLTVVALVTYS